MSKVCNAVEKTYLILQRLYILEVILPPGMALVDKIVGKPGASTKWGPPKIYLKIYIFFLNNLNSEMQGLKILKKKSSVPSIQNAVPGALLPRNRISESI